MKKSLLLTALFLLGTAVMAQHSCQGVQSQTQSQKTSGPELQVKGAEVVVIQTNAYSKKSNEIFANKLAYEKGIKEFKFDENTSKIAVAYDKTKTNTDVIRKSISKLGFDADEVKADAAARAKLPAECTTMPKGCSRPCGKH